MPDEAVLRKYTLPESVVNSQELRYDPREDVWVVSSGGVSTLDLSRYREDCTPLFLQSLKLALVTLNRTLQPTTITNYLRSGLNPLLEHLQKPCGEITREGLESYWFTLSTERKYWFKGLKTLCPALALHGIPGHSTAPDVMDWLKTIKIGRNETGWAARTWDPVLGPLTPDEMHAFISVLHASFARAEISTEDYFVILLFSCFGARNANLADLKVCDLKITHQKGVTSYEIDIPRVKQRGGRFRESSYTRKLVPEIGAALEGYLSYQMHQYGYLGMGDQLPMFVNPGNADLIRKFHQSSDNIGNRACQVATRLAVVTDRTGEGMHINARRWRYTQATLARAQGLDPAVIAALLDHGSTETQEVYAAVSPEVLADYARRLAGFREPWAATFLGRVADPGEEPDPMKVVFRAKFARDSSDPSVGGCGASRLCAGRRPFVCYLCAMFNASMEGDHAGALADVLDGRVRFDQDAGDGLRYLTADSVAQAIRKVIALVERRLNEMNKTLLQIRAERDSFRRERGLT